MQLIGWIIYKCSNYIEICNHLTANNINNINNKPVAIKNSLLKPIVKLLKMSRFHTKTSDPWPLVTSHTKFCRHNFFLRLSRLTDCKSILKTLPLDILLHMSLQHRMCSDSERAEVGLRRCFPHLHIQEGLNIRLYFPSAVFVGLLPRSAVSQEGPKSILRFV